MKCNCCDRDLSDAEVVWNEELGRQPGTGAWEMCSTCLTVAMETAYSQGFHRPDDSDLELVELGDDVPDPEVETLDGGFEAPEQLTFVYPKAWEESYD